MNIAEAAHKLREMYDNAPEGEKATQIHFVWYQVCRRLSPLTAGRSARTVRVTSLLCNRSE